MAALNHVTDDDYRLLHGGGAGGAATLRGSSHVVVFLCLENVQRKINYHTIRLICIINTIRMAEQV